VSVVGMVGMVCYILSNSYHRQQVIGNSTTIASTSTSTSNNSNDSNINIAILILL
jgi:hypothetical protein